MLFAIQTPVVYDYPFNYIIAENFTCTCFGERFNFTEKDTFPNQDENIIEGPIQRVIKTGI